MKKTSFLILITAYTEQPHSATLTLINHGFRTWKLAAIDSSGKEWSVFNTYFTVGNPKVRMPILRIDNITKF